MFKLSYKICIQKVPGIEDANTDMEIHGRFKESH